MSVKEQQMIPDVQMHSTLYPADWVHPKTGKAYTKEEILEALSAGKFGGLPIKNARATLVDPLRFASVYISELNKVKNKLRKSDIIQVDYLESSITFKSLVSVEGKRGMKRVHCKKLLVVYTLEKVEKKT